MSWECILCWIEHHPGLASWVQAVGSIGAIIAAVWVSGREGRLRARIEKAARRDAIDRAIAASEEAKDIIDKTLGHFSCTRPSAAETPRYIAFIDHAAARVKDASAGPGVDVEVLGHVSEVSSALVDVKGLVEQSQKSADGCALISRDYLRANVTRIEHVIEGLRAIRK